MLHCLRNDSYEALSDKPCQACNRTGTASFGDSWHVARISSAPVTIVIIARRQQMPFQISQVEISLSFKIHVNLHDCSVKTLISLIKEME